MLVHAHLKARHVAFAGFMLVHARGVAFAGLMLVHARGVAFAGLMLVHARGVAFAGFMLVHAFSALAAAVVFALATVITTVFTYYFLDLLTVHNKACALVSLSSSGRVHVRSQSVCCAHFNGER
jgi:hypothetical protein